MTSERVKRRIERLLDQADAALENQDYRAALQAARAALGFDPGNTEAAAFVEAAQQALAVVPGVKDAGPDSAPPVSAHSSRSSTSPRPSAPDAGSSGGEHDTPTSFAGGRYEVSKFLGEGGKKRVYQAHDTLLDREVAFALIKTEGFDQTSKERISREAQAMGRLGVHPNIVAVLDLGQEDDGSPYMVTELMGGGDVEALLEDATRPTPESSIAVGGAGPSQGEDQLMPPPSEGGGLEVGGNALPLDRTIEIGKAVCEGLEFAHARGIVHRDLKPGNVWLTEDSSSGPGQAQVAKIGDFGLAVMTDRSRLTREGMMVGTVSYMPPEQATGGEITPRADLYSLGAMLYEMVTGRPPFLGDDEVAIIGQHINTPPVAPTWHNGTCPRPLEALVMRLLSKDPAERPESAQDVFNALDAIDLAARGETVERESNSLDSLAGGVFVGRQAEMGQLKAALEDVLGGSGRLVTLMGEPGIGKTRTSEELATYAGLRGAQVLWGRCYETGGQPPYWPWVQAIRSYVREIDPDELRRQMGSSASVVAEIVTDIKDRLPETRPPSQLDDPDSARFRLFDSIASFLKSASQTQPLVIVLDDLHWSDRPSLTFLEFMAREIGQSRVLLICTYRDVELNRRHPLTVTLGDLARERLYECVLLRGLSEPDIARFIEIAAGSSAPSELAATVYRHTEGNPLFVTEVVRELVQSGELAESHASGASTWSVRIPEGVREVIGRRLDRLSERANEALTVAAVVGRDFRLDALRELAEDTTEGQLLDVLDEALDARIIEELTDEIGHYQFTHAVMQETLTGELSLTRRVRIHARIAETLERLYHDEADEHAGELAYHFGQAETLTGTDKLVRYSAIAGEQALANYAPSDAEPYFSRAWDVVKTDSLGPETAPILWGLARSRAPSVPVGEAQELWADFERVFDYFAGIGDTSTAASVVTYPMYFIGALQNATHLFDKALAVVDPDSLQAGWILLRRAIADRVDRGYQQGGQEDLEKAIAIASQHADERFTIRVTAVRAMLERDARKAVEIADELFDDPQAGQDQQGLIRAAVAGAQAGVFLGDNGAAIRMATRLMESSGKTQERVWWTTGYFVLASVHARAGDWTSHEKLLAGRQPTGYEGDRRGDDTAQLVGQLRGMHTEDPGPFLDNVRESLDRGAGFLQIGAGGVIGRLAEGEFLAVLRHRTGWEDIGVIAAESVRLARGLASPWSYHGGWPSEQWADALYAYCAEDLALIESLDFPAPGGECFGFVLNHDHVAGELLRLAGQYERAIPYYEASRVISARTGIKTEQAWTCSDYAEMLLDRASADPSSAPGIADQEKAVELQDEALAIARDLACGRSWNASWRGGRS